MLLTCATSPPHTSKTSCLYNAENRQSRTETEQFKRSTYDELVARDKASLDIFWLQDKSLEDVENLPPPALIAAKIVEDLEAALGEFALIAESLAETRELGADAHLFEGPPE